jgi:sigma-E factor negative regulatory protein RseA
MERLSALMDDELDEYAIDGELDRIKGDPQREEAWATYHMIGDALRGQIDPVRGIDERVRTVLANEPTVLAPRSWKSNHVTQRVVLPLAASICGIAVVAWLALSSNSVISPVNNQVNNSMTPDVLATAPQVVQQPYAIIAEGSDASGIESIGSTSTDSAAEDMREYLMAHQQYSPSTAMQGVVPYVRTVSSGDAAR